MKCSALSLRFFFILVVSLITLFITVALTYVTSKQYKKEAVDQLIHHVSIVSHDFSVAIMDYIITENYSSLEEFVLSYSDRPHLKSISVLTPDGVIIADSQPERLGQVLEGVAGKQVESLFVNFQSDTMLSLSPVRLDGTVVGWCRLTVDTQYLRESLNALQIKVIAWAAAIWLLAILVVLAIAAFITRPISKIMAVAQEVSSGNFSRKTDVEGPREIRQLGLAFNAMTDELQNRELLLKRSEFRFRSLVEDINDWVWEIDENGVYTYSSPAVEKILGFTPDEVIGKTPYDLMPKDEAERVRKKFEQARDQVDFENLININLHKNGQLVTLETAGRLIFDDDGKPKGYRGVDRDITERERAARERKQLEQQLHHAQKMEAIGTLAGGIAHDFNNILAAMMGYAEIIEMDLPKGSQAAKDIEQVITAGYRATELIKQILTFSRKTDQKKQALRIDIVIKEALKMLRSFLPASIEIETQVDKECGLVYADPTNVHQVIVNLCTNGSQAIGNNKGRLTVMLKQVKLTSEQLVDKPRFQGCSFVVLTVQDTGRGMDEQTMARIFEPYFTSRDMGDGTGLGLAVIHGIVEDCDGFVEVESSPGKGTALRVYFPVIEEEVVESTEAKSQVSLPVGTETVLVVDDEPNLTEITKIFLTRLGYTVETAGNGTDALEKFRASPASFDVVITDQTMPDLTGIELAQAILQERADLPIILSTGYTSAISEEEAYSRGIRRFVTKPLGKKELAEVVREVLDEQSA